MEVQDERELFAQYSRGEIDRRALSRALNRDIDFGDVLLKLREYRLKLPRPPHDPQSPGSRILRALLQRQPLDG